MRGRGERKGWTRWIQKENFGRGRGDLILGKNEIDESVEVGSTDRKKHKEEQMSGDEQ